MTVPEKPEGREVCACGHPLSTHWGRDGACEHEADGGLCCCPYFKEPAAPAPVPAEPATYESDAAGWALSDEHEPGTLVWKGGTIMVEPDGAISEGGIAVMTPEAAEARAAAYAQAAAWSRLRRGDAPPAPVPGDGFDGLAAARKVLVDMWETERAASQRTSPRLARPLLRGAAVLRLAIDALDRLEPAQPVPGDDERRVSTDA